MYFATSTNTMQLQLIDLHKRAIYGVELTLEDGKIARIQAAQVAENAPYVLPGFVDAHVHIESSMLLPTEFARIAVQHGTVATVSDPHEIANVVGIAGVEYMLENAALSPMKFFFGAPSCVPATAFETAGAQINAQGIIKLLARNDIWYLSEMMNYPAVVARDPLVMDKIQAAKAANKPIDGHAPALSGQALQQYVAAGISTDHECFTLEEALEKAALNMKILVREGSAAKNFDALHPLLGICPEKLMFCSDDKHPDDLLQGHINLLVKRALALGYDLFDVLYAACVHPVVHYNLPVGLLREGDAADFIIIDNLQNFTIQQCWIAGQQVYKNGQLNFNTQPFKTINHFNAYPIKPTDFQVMADGNQMQVIEAIDGQLITSSFSTQCIAGQEQKADIRADILKIAVINRYHKSPVSTAFIRGFGLKNGALASTVAHDSHNIVVVGTNDTAMAAAANKLMALSGGICFVDEHQDYSLALPVAGLMSTDSAEEVATAYTAINQQVKANGCTLTAPFMTLSFMALLVIPALKISDKGLFDGEKFAFTPLFKNQL
jgi:adenine deaminase